MKAYLNDENNSQDIPLLPFRKAETQLVHAVFFGDFVLVFIAEFRLLRFVSAHLDGHGTLAVVRSVGL